MFVKQSRFALNSITRTRLSSAAVNNKLQFREGRTKSGKQLAADASDLERAKESDDLANMKIDFEPLPYKTDFAVEKFQPEEYEQFFDTDTEELEARFENLYQRNRRVGDVYSKMHAPLRGALPAREGKVTDQFGNELNEEVDEILHARARQSAELPPKELFERQIGYNEKFQALELEEEARAQDSAARNLENDPKFSTTAVQQFLSDSEKQYLNYLKKNNLKAYDEYIYYNKNAPFNSNVNLFIGEDNHKRYNGEKAEVISSRRATKEYHTKEAQIERFRRTQQFVSQKYVDTPNIEYQHLFAELAPHTISNTEFSKMYIVSNDDYRHYFSGGLGGELDKTFDSLSQRAIMLRPPVMPVINELKKVKMATVNPEKAAAESNVAPKKRGFVFNGIRGSGKSAVLATVVHHAFKQRFLVFYIPSARYWTHGIHFVEPSPLLQGYFDAPYAETEFLKHFQAANDDILKSMNLSKDHDLPLEAGQKQPTTLYDLITYGLSLETNIPVVFKLLMDELLNNTTVPMLFAIDDINFLSEPSGFHYGNLDLMNVEQPEVVHASKFVLSRYINQIIAYNKPNHIVVGANTLKYPMKNKIDLNQSPLEVVQVPRYSLAEIRNICDYYMSAYWTGTKHEEFLQDLIFMSGAIPGLVWKEMHFV